MLVQRLAVCAVTPALTVACASAVVVNTGDRPSRAETTASPSPTGRFDPNLVNAHDFYAEAAGAKGYYFTTPSGKWNCAILPRTEAGCQTAAGAQRLGIPGGPDTVRGPDGAAVAPNAIAVGDEADPGFTWIDRPGFSPTSGKALTLDFNKTLVAAGFRCNVQDTGVSCGNEITRKGFTFSATGYLPQYTPVPG
jgi:hypothetical protein